MAANITSIMEPRVPARGRPKKSEQDKLKRKAQPETMDSSPKSIKKIRLGPPKTSFFTLPRELRDQIYHETWRMKAPLTVQCGEYTFNVDYEESESALDPSIADLDLCTPPKRRRRTRKPRSPWFLANKQFMHEAIYQLQSKSHWSLQPGYTAKFARRNPQTFPSKASSLLNPWDAKSLVITDKYAYFTMSIQDDGNVGAVLGFADANARHFQGLRALAPPTPRLRHLYVNFGVSSQGLQVLGGTAIAVDFSALKHLGAPNLQQVRFTVILPKGDKFDEGLRDKIRAETGNLGKEILGGVGREDFAFICPPRSGFMRDGFFGRKPKALVWKHILRKV